MPFVLDTFYKYTIMAICIWSTDKFRGYPIYLRIQSFYITIYTPTTIHINTAFCNRFFQINLAHIYVDATVFWLFDRRRSYYFFLGNFLGENEGEHRKPSPSHVTKPRVSFVPIHRGINELLPQGVRVHPDSKTWIL